MDKDNQKINNVPNNNIEYFKLMESRSQNIATTSSTIN